MPDLSAVQKLIAQMRLIKSPAEVALLQQAASISAKAHNLAMQRVTPGMKEYQLAAEYIYHFTQNGALDVAYLPIVGGGQNACTLHYVANTDTLRDGDLVLVDAGCEYQYYCADVSRTFPVNGRFTNEQKALYDMVLNAYLAGLEKIKPGNNWTMVREAVDKSLTAGLSDLKIPGELKEFFMHGPGHWLGLDVHDVGPYKVHDKPITFSAGMVLTLEPGIYIDEPAQVDKKWWHTGIRIEDDILVTEQGPQVLTQESPILPQDIEQLMR
jgi:Xaa-Pro aminopeptidase